GARALVDRDGWRLEVEPTLWRRGQEAVAHIDRAVPAALHVPTPALGTTEIPRPLGVRERRRMAFRQEWRYARERLGLVGLLGLGVFFLAILLVLAALTVANGAYSMIAWALIVVGSIVTYALFRMMEWRDGRRALREFETIQDEDEEPGPASQQTVVGERGAGTESPPLPDEDDQASATKSR
ncbi:MAG TPA: hypothetical protein VI110_15820, partial [Lapillicoccus sp.]